MNLLETIDSYLEAIKEIQESINQIQGDKFLKNHKKTLFFSLIETISKGVYGVKYPMNYTRFEKFIMEFCEWEDAKRVSLQQLALLLEKTNDRDFSRLKSHVHSHLIHYPDESPVPFSYDATVEEIKELMPRGETTINGVDIYSITHVNLLWKYRNSLVHEARSIGSIEAFNFVEYPHYVHFTILEKDVSLEVWKICYPIQFFNNLIEVALVSVRERLIENGQDPLENYDFDQLWIKPRKKKIEK